MYIYAYIYLIYTYIQIYSYIHKAKISKTKWWNRPSITLMGDFNTLLPGIDSRQKKKKGIIIELTEHLKNTMNKDAPYLFLLGRTLHQSLCQTHPASFVRTGEDEWRSVFYISNYVNIINQGKKLSKYVLLSYIDKYTFIMIN